MQRVLMLIPMLAAAAFGQSTQAYLFAGPTSTINSVFTNWQGTHLHAGGGAEGRLGRGFTLGGEAGVVPGSGRYVSTAGILSAGPAYHFLWSGNIDPFVAGGVSLLASRGAGLMMYAGGGATWWFRRQVGLRVEFRDHIWTPESGSTLHFAGVRFGVAFRGQ